MAGSRNVVKFPQLLEMSVAGSNALQEYINTRIEEVDADQAIGAVTLIRLLAVINDRLIAKPNRKDSTDWLIAQDEMVLKGLLGASRKKLAGAAKPKDDTLALERMKAEILAAMMEYVLSKSQKRKGTQISPIYVAAINQYGTDADRALLADAGYKISISIAGLRRLGEKESVKQERVSQQKQEIVSVLKSTLERSPILGIAVSNLEENRQAFADLFANAKGGVDKVIDDLTRFAVNADKMDSMNIKSLLQIAASIEQSASFINKLIHELGVNNDPSLGKRLKLYRQLQDINEHVIVQQQKLAGIMLEKLKLLEGDVFTNLNPKDVDFKAQYICDKRIREWKDQGAGTKTIELLIQQANKKKGKEIEIIDVADIIKFQAYISKSGTSEQKKELLDMQDIHIVSTPTKNWLEAKLDEWNIACSPDIQLAILDMQTKHHFFETQADLIFLRDLLKNVANYEDERVMLNVLNRINTSSLLESGSEFREFCKFTDNFKYESTFDSGKDQLLERLIMMCNDADDLSVMMSSINQLDEKQKTFFVKLVDLKDTSTDPAVPAIATFADVDLVLPVLEDCVMNPALMSLCVSLVEKFKNDNQRDLLTLLSDCAKLSTGSYEKGMLVSPELILDLLPQASTIRELRTTIDDVATRLENAGFLQDMLLYYDISKFEVNAMIKDTFNIDIDNNLNMSATIEQQKAAIGSKGLEQGSIIYEEIINKKMINTDKHGEVKTAAHDIMRLVHSVEAAMQAVANHDHQALSEKLNDMLSEIVAFKAYYKDANGFTHQNADAIINSLVDKLTPKLTEASDRKMVLNCNLVKALARTASTAKGEGKDLIESTLQLSAQYSGELDGEQKLLKLVNKSLKLVHTPDVKSDEIDKTIKSLQSSESSAKLKGKMLRFAESLLAFIGKIIKPAAVKSEAMKRKIGLFEVKEKSASTLREKMRDLKDSRTPPPPPVPRSRKR